jgi:import receptor subunit TOM70
MLTACPLRSARQNVLPIVNKGLALYQWKQDIGAAEQCCSDALAIDDECEAAVATLAQLSLQQNKIERAVELFERQAALARSEPELTNALTYKFVSCGRARDARARADGGGTGVGGAARLRSGVPGDG